MHALVCRLECEKNALICENTMMYKRAADVCARVHLALHRAVLADVMRDEDGTAKTNCIPTNMGAHPSFSLGPWIPT